MPNWYSLWALVPEGGYVKPTDNPLKVNVYSPTMGEYYEVWWRINSHTWERKRIVVELESVA